jgi:hypothetical protein
MNLRERIQIRTLINLIISVIERLSSLFIKLTDKNKPKIDIPNLKPDKKRPLKKVIDTIDNIIPIPWKNKK